MIMIRGYYYCEDIKLKIRRYPKMDFWPWNQKEDEPGFEYDNFSDETDELYKCPCDFEDVYDREFDDIYQ